MLLCCCDEFCRVQPSLRTELAAGGTPHCCKTEGIFLLAQRQAIGIELCVL